MPIIVTESGCADGTEPDNQRTRYLSACLGVAQKLMADGVDLRGWLVWTLMDNFEWAEGFAPRFGLLKTDFKTLERSERQSNAVIKKAVKKFVKEFKNEFDVDNEVIEQCLGELDDVPPPLEA